MDTHTLMGLGSMGCQVGLVFPRWVEQDQPGLGIILLDPKQAGKKVSAKPCEQWGDELTPRRAEFVGLAQLPVLGPPRAGQVTPEGWADVGAAALHPGVTVPSGQHWCGVRRSGCGCC